MIVLLLICEHVLSTCKVYVYKVNKNDRFLLSVRQDVKASRQVRYTE